MTLRSVVCASCVIASDVVGRAVRREPRIGHLEVQDAVDLQLRVVLGDADLRRHVERRLAQVVPVGDAVDERHDEIEAGREHARGSARAARRPTRAAAARRGSP